MKQDLTLREALAEDRLDDFVRQEEDRGVELANGSDLERALALLTIQRRTEDRSFTAALEKKWRPAEADAGNADPIPALRSRAAHGFVTEGVDMSKSPIGNTKELPKTRASVSTPCANLSIAARTRTLRQPRQDVAKASWRSSGPARDVRGARVQEADRLTGHNPRHCGIATMSALGH
jgi:hypothetical protein